MVRATCGAWPVARRRFLPAKPPRRHCRVRAPGREWPAADGARGERPMRCALGIAALLIPVVAIAPTVRLARAAEESTITRGGSPQIDRAGRAVSEETAGPQQGDLARAAQLWRRSDPAVHAGPVELRLRAGRRGGSQGPDLLALLSSQHDVHLRAGDDGVWRRRAQKRSSF